MSSAREAALARIRQAREAGASGLSEYQEEAAHSNALYDEVTEEEYKAHRRKEIINGGGEFVTDDDGLGYVDYGQDEWRSEDESEDEEDFDAGKSKRKRKAKPEAKGSIKNALSKQAQKPKPKAPAAPPMSKATEEDLLESIFGDLEEQVPQHIAKKIKSEPTIRPLLSAYARSPYAAPRKDHIVTPTKRAAASVPVPSVLESGTRPSSENTQQAETYDFQTQGFDDAAFSVDESNLPAAENDDVSEVVPDEPMEVEHVDDSVVEVKVKPLQHRAVRQMVSYAPKFERAEVAQAEADIVSAPDNAHCRGWLSVNDSLTVRNMDPSQSTHESSLNSGARSGPEILEEDGTLHMFWFDAFDKNGVVYLFGKVLDRNTRNYVSCCTRINNIQRNVFVLPRKTQLDSDGNVTDSDVSLGDVYTEFDTLRRKHGIKEYASAQVPRHYAFEVPGVPAEADYLKVAYSYTQPELPANLSGRTFSRIFGANTGALETFILKRRLMGPCWVQIKEAKLSNRGLSWCRVEIEIDDPKMLNPFKEGDPTAPKTAPPLTVMSLTLRTVKNHDRHVNEIVAASGLVYTNVDIDGGSNDNLQPSRFTVMRPLVDIPLPAGFTDLLQRQKTKIETPGNERALLSFLMAKIHRSDPDIIVGHNFIDFDLDVLLHRMKANKVDYNTWSKIGRLRRTDWPKLQAGAGGTSDSTYQERQIASGRLLCDTYRAAQDLIKSKSFSLTSLAASQLDVDRPDIDYEKLPTYFWDSEKLLEMIQHCEFDGYLNAQLMFKLQVLPLTKQLTNLAGNLWSRTMTGARAERNEYLLLHEFHNRKFIVPDKYFPNKSRMVVDQLQEHDDDQPAAKKGTAGRRKPAFAGGLVLEPKKGFYDKYVLLLDFNSLYPSIIQEYNICFTTVTRGGTDAAAEDVLPEIPDEDLPRGILPRLLGNLVDRRRVVKNLMKDPRATAVELAQYDIRQKGLKLTANSMYGCLGFAHSRFYAKPLAMLITSKGREILQNTVHVAEGDRLDVIYGDTDSIMINTNSTDLEEVKKIGADFKKAINKRYRLLEIEMDGYFQRLLLLKKKKYAAIVVEEKKGQLVMTRETKGLDLVRRDWCGLSHDVSTYILDQLFSDAGKEEVLEKIHGHLSRVAEEARAGRIPIERFVITKGLTKNPEEYADIKAQPQVQVALRMRTRGNNVRAGDTVPYVICLGDPAATMAERARHPDDLTREGSTLKIDVEWYLSTQVHPPAARLCAPIDGTDVARLADCLGLDASKYHTVSAGSGASGDTDADALYTLDSQLSDEERFKAVEKWKPVCRTCKATDEFKGAVRLKDGASTSSFACPSCTSPLSTPSLVAQLTTAIRSHIKRYGNAWTTCPSATGGCGSRLRSTGVYAEKCPVETSQGPCTGALVIEYDDAALYTQLLYFESLFNIDKAEKTLPVDDQDAKAKFGGIVTKDILALETLREVASAYLEKNARRFVNLEQLFAFAA
ncbi:DNA-directed DNA polymerase alpha catalytic subunit pol1 [Thoreauomyces humboldtii]|nr:DNA-directed DNA polymerase alpha catalytic subunit pol1 [Thoreauomyces humboldtii]